MNLISRYATAGLVSVLLVACAEKSADEYIAAAKGYVAEGDYPSALIELRSAAQQEPGSGEVRYHLAKLSLAAGDFATAEKEAQMALDRGIDAGRAQPLLVEALFRQRKLDEAVEAGRTLADGASDADRALIMGLVGQGLLSQLDYPGAEQLFELALEIDPDSIEPMVGLSALARLSNDNEGARRWAEKARDANPESARAWGVLGDIESMEGRREAALESFDRAVELSTYVGMDHVKRTHMRVLLQQYDERSEERRARERVLRHV